MRGAFDARREGGEVREQTRDVARGVVSVDGSSAGKSRGKAHSMCLKGRLEVCEDRRRRDALRPWWLGVITSAVCACVLLADVRVE